MTDNNFQLREDSPIVHKLDKLIATRNALIHPHTIFYTELTKSKRKPRKQRAIDHPLHKLSMKDCREFYRAARAFNRKFFSQIDRGFIKGNDLINEIKSRRYLKPVAQLDKTV
jgi:hypothetical protein